MAKTRTQAIGDCMYSLLWWIPDSMNWTPELHETIYKELEKLYEEGVEHGKEGKL